MKATVDLHSSDVPRTE